MSHPAFATLFALASSHHAGGRLPQAEQLYRQILAADPAHAEAAARLGLLLIQAGHAAPALELLDRCLTHHPGGADLLGARGLALKELGRPADAVDSLKAALRRKPGSFELLYNLGNAQLQAGRLEDAAASLRGAAKRRPGEVGPHNNLGNAWRQLGRHAEAAASFRRAVSLAPGAAPLHFNLAAALALSGQPGLAIESYRAAARLAPENPELWHHLGRALAGLKRFAEARDAYRTALRHGGNSAPLHQDLARVLAAQDLREDAAAHVRRAVAAAPGDPQTHAELGMLLRDLGDDAAAQASFHHALTLNPGHMQARYHLGLCHLLAGRLEQGWPLYEARLEANTGHASRFTEPSWQGDAIAGQTLLLHAEQGLGDSVQFCRFVGEAAARSQARIILEIQPPLLSLLAKLPGIAAIHAAGDRLPHFDQHCALPSLPAALETTPAMLAAEIPYLFADPSRAAAWRQRLAALPGLKVGLAWAGNAEYEHDDLRSLPADSLPALDGVRGVCFVSLQKERGIGPDGRAPRPVAIDWTAELTDMAETAALMQGLDLVISADTSMVHLAGALGRPVWLINRRDTEWRWQRDRTDSPWYPTLRQFRQARRGDWAQPLGDIRAALLRLTDGPSLDGTNPHSTDPT